MRDSLIAVPSGFILYVWVSPIVDVAPATPPIGFRRTFVFCAIFSLFCFMRLNVSPKNLDLRISKEEMNKVVLFNSKVKKDLKKY